MKKMFALLLGLILILSMTSCGTKEEVPEQMPSAPVEPETLPQPEPSPEQPEELPPADEDAPDAQPLLDLLETMVAGVDDEIVLVDRVLEPEEFESQLFIPYIEGAQAVVSEPMIGSMAHSVVLLQLPEDADADAVADSIRENMNPRKWICVEAEKTEVKVSGQYVLLIMSTQPMTDAISARFDEQMKH